MRMTPINSKRPCPYCDELHGWDDLLHLGQSYYCPIKQKKLALANDVWPGNDWSWECGKRLKPSMEE